MDEITMPEVREQINFKVCSIEGCGNPVKCKGICNKHYHVMLQTKKLKPCACGCGEKTSYTFKHGHHTRLFSSEEQSRRGQMNDGSALRGRGNNKSYRKVGQRHEHRAVAEQKLGRTLVKGEIVHHINGDKFDNRPENLEVMTQSEHIKHHLTEMLEARINGK